MIRLLRLLAAGLRDDGVWAIEGPCAPVLGTAIKRYGYKVPFPATSHPPHPSALHGAEQTRSKAGGGDGLPPAPGVQG
jgi:hypothetical protein